MKKIIPLHFLENRCQEGYTNFGAIWEQGQVTSSTAISLIADGKPLAVQTRETAYWPDGSIKWTNHCAKLEPDTKQISISSDNSNAEVSMKSIRCTETADYIQIDTGKLQAAFRRNGNHVIEDIKIEGRIAAVKGELICILEKRSNNEFYTNREEVSYISSISSVVIEEKGPLKVVVKVEGKHVNLETSREIIPFILRFTFYQGETYMPITHSFLYDGEAERDFLKGLGITFTCPVQGAAYNRHVKLGGDYSYFNEALQLLLSWHPKIESEIYEKQLKNKNLYFSRQKDSEIFKAIDDMTIWSNYHLSQDSDRHYTIRKRTAKDVCSYINCIEGEHSKGVACFSDEKGGVILGLRDFWQKYPSSLWIDDLAKDEAKMTAWMWSPESEAMDFRHYDTVGHASAYYEGFDEVGATPYGIGNTNELIFAGFNREMPEDRVLDKLATQLNKPAVLIAEPEYYHQIKAFGSWGMQSKKTKVEKWFEDQLDAAIDFYKDEIKVRGWYGLFNYGDVMHTYDAARHCWRYDMGGYAWQNTELVPTLWLWYSFLRSGREDIFSLAEAMTRHCSEVDIYHLGKYKGLGSRHNVMHWGCSCKEPRIAMAGHHRMYYYLTGDYRLGDIFEDVKDADFSSVNMDPLRYFYDKEKMIYPTHARSGPDWSSYCSNWMTQWERRKDEDYKEKLLTGIEDLKKAPLQLISGSDFEYNPESSHLRYIGECAAGGSHLVICMGAAQTWIELGDLLNDKEWEKMLADYGAFYFDTKEEKLRKSHGQIGNKGFAYPYMAATMGAYAARYYHNEELGRHIWRIMKDTLMDETGGSCFNTEQVKSYINRETLPELRWVSTNFVSQWCLNVIMCLDLIRQWLPSDEDIKESIRYEIS